MTSGPPAPRAWAAAERGPPSPSTPTGSGTAACTTRTPRSSSPSTCSVTAWSAASSTTSCSERRRTMACHEIAALRLGLMHVLGRADEAERQHELAELGDAALAPGPLRSLCAPGALASVRRLYDGALAEPHPGGAAPPAGHPRLPYY